MSVTGHEPSSETPRSLARAAWDRLASRGSATETVARVLDAVGIDDYIDAFSREYLGPDGGQTFKLILGLNGEGKTHLMRKIERTALERGHVVAFVEAKSAGAAESPFSFGREVLQSLRVLGGDFESDDQPLAILLRAAVERKRQRLLADSLDPDALLPDWADGFRTKNLQPLSMAQAVSEGLKAVIRSDTDRLVSAIQTLSFDGVQLPQGERVVQGANVLRSLARLPRFLGFERLVLLVDEAEVAFEGLAQARRQNLLNLLRYLNDHLTASDVGGAAILLACADEMWPNRFNEYGALKGRLSDQGADRVEDRVGLSLRALVVKNKLWVRETFRGTVDDYRRLGDAILVVGSRVYPSLDIQIQASNAATLATIASSNDVNRVVKRPFVKSLAQLVQNQLVDDKQSVVGENEARHLFDLARRSAAEGDAADAEPDA